MVKTIACHCITGEDGSVTVAKIHTGKGERLEIRRPDGAAIRIDAIGLEALSWQSPNELVDVLGCTIEAVCAPDTNAEGSTLTVSNEYADAIVSIIEAPPGHVLEVNSPKKRTGIRLDATALFALAAKPPEIFSTFLETPHGPKY